MALPSRDEVKRLVEFLPGFTEPNRSFVKGWSGGVDRATGANLWRSPEYNEDVVRFFELIASSEWAVRDYLNDRTSEFVADPDRLASSSIEEVCDVLAHCWRGERFCDGYHQSTLEAGVVQAALQRLEQLTATLPEDES